MNNDNDANRDQLENNLERLLSRTPPNLTMPPAGKARILEALKAQETERNPKLRLIARKGQAMITSKRTPWATAAAAAIILVLIGLWPSGAQNGIAWANVVEQLNAVRTLTGHITSKGTPGSGTRDTRTAKFFYKDPGRSRTESYAPSGAVESIVIITRGEQQSTQVRLLPQEQTAHRTTHLFSGDVGDLRPPNVLYLAEDSWSRLVFITTDATREIGERNIEGIPAVGFETPLEELFDTSSPERPRGTLRVWADRETAVPLAVEAQYRDGRGFPYETTIDHIEWDLPLDNDLFELPHLDGWKFEDNTVKTVGFTKTRLKKGVTVRAGLSGGPAVLTEEDIAAVLSGKRVEAPGGEQPPRVTITMTLTAQAGEKLSEFTAKHQGKRATIDFNDEVQIELTIGGVIRDRMQIDISSLGMTLEGFEDRYLTAVRPAGG